MHALQIPYNNAKNSPITCTLTVQLVQVYREPSLRFGRRVRKNEKMRSPARNGGFQLHSFTFASIVKKKAYYLGDNIVPGHGRKEEKKLNQIYS